MVHHPLSVLVVVLGIGHPGEARAGGTTAELVEQVTALHSAGSFTAAAELADANARREELDAASRVLLGGLARHNYELSFEAGGPPTALCKAAKIMRHVAPLDTPAGGASKLKAAERAEEQLAQVLGPSWTTTCDPPAAPVEPGVVAAKSEAEPGVVREAPIVQPPLADRQDRRRVRIGVATLIPGLVLFAPMAGLLAYRAQGERDFLALNLDTAGRMTTEAEDTRAVALNQRYSAATAGAIALGVTGSALVVTGVVLAATGARQRHLSLAPWGARGLGGLVFQGRF